jgi:hypothetical protein
VPNPGPVSGTCPDFNVTATFTNWNVYSTTETLSDGTVIIQVAGPETGTITNDSTGKTLPVDATGPGTTTIHPDGSVTVVSEGSSLYTPPLALTEKFGTPGVFVSHGLATYEVDASGDLVSFTHVGPLVDLCAALS